MDVSSIIAFIFKKNVIFIQLSIISIIKVLYKYQFRKEFVALCSKKIQEFKMKIIATRSCLP